MAGGSLSASSAGVGRQTWCKTNGFRARGCGRKIDRAGHQRKAQETPPAGHIERDAVALVGERQGRTARYMGAPVFRQIGSVIGFLLERHQQKMGHGVGGKLDVEQPRGRGKVVDVLPHAVIPESGHRLVKVRSPHGLKGGNNFGASKPESGRAAKRHTGDAELVHVIEYPRG